MKIGKYASDGADYIDGGEGLKMKEDFLKAMAKEQEEQLRIRSLQGNARMSGDLRLADVSENTDIDTLKALVAKEVGCDTDMNVFYAMRHYMCLHDYKGVMDFVSNEATVKKGDKITRQAFPGKLESQVSSGNVPYHRRALMLAFMYMRNLEKTADVSEKESENNG